MLLSRNEEHPNVLDRICAVWIPRNLSQFVSEVRKESCIQCLLKRLRLTLAVRLRNSRTIFKEIAYIYHWKCRTSKVRRTIHRIHLIEFFDVLYVEIIRLQVNTTSKKNLSRKSNDITSKSSQSMHRKLKGVRMSINFPSTYLGSQHVHKFEIENAPYLSQVLSFDLHEGRKWVLRRKLLRHHQDQVPAHLHLLGLDGLKMVKTTAWSEERKREVTSS